ncbi:MAG TPA: alpha-L-fucosidase [Thermoguttaceae bacterium]|nr:alpha-L-fucosidase [Thermoguttaceae bacterium]
MYESANSPATVNRRKFLYEGCSRAGSALLGGAAACRALGAFPQEDDDHRSATAAADGTSLPRPTPAQIAWQECEIGLLYSFDLAVASGVFAGNNTVRETLDPGRYNPEKLDTDQWLEAAKAAGAQYAVFTATHFNGFMQWQSDLYPYGLKQTAWRGGKGDVVGDFVESCRKAGIKPGLYFSTHRNAYWEVWGHYTAWGKGRDTDAQARFNRVAEKMTEELCSRYGPLVQIWYDAGVKTPSEGGPDVLPIFEKHQPDSVFYHSRQRSDVRWIGNEVGHAGVPCWATMPIVDGEVSHNATAWKKHLHGGLADGEYWSPGMVDVPLRGARGVHNWFWAPEQDHAAYPTETLVKMYDQSVGRNCNLLIGEVVQSDGQVPQSDVRRLAEFGQAIRRRFADPLGETRGEGTELELPLSRPQKIGQIVLMEEIALGERVREYQVQGLGADGTWTKLAEGQSIGHKWIHRIEPVEVARLKLSVTRWAAKPMIRRFAVFG